MKLIIGLGNPGKEYENTRHNTGFMVLDRLSEKLNIEMTQNKFKGIYLENLLDKLWISLKSIKKIS